MGGEKGGGFAGLAAEAASAGARGEGGGGGERAVAVGTEGGERGGERRVEEEGGVGKEDLARLDGGGGY